MRASTVPFPSRTQTGGLAVVLLLGDVEIGVLAARDAVRPAHSGLLLLSISCLRMSEAGLRHARNAIRLYGVHYFGGGGALPLLHVSRR
jgi:hypothetical protein